MEVLGDLAVSAIPALNMPVRASGSARTSALAWLASGNGASRCWHGRCSRTDEDGSHPVPMSSVLYERATQPRPRARGADAEALGRRRTPGLGGPVDAATLIRLQRTAGNAAVVAERLRHALGRPVPRSLRYSGAAATSMPDAPARLRKPRPMSPASASQPSSASASGSCSAPAPRPDRQERRPPARRAGSCPPTLRFDRTREQGLHF